MRILMLVTVSRQNFVALMQCISKTPLALQGVWHHPVLQELKIKRKKKKKQKSRRTLSSNKTVFITKSLVSSGVSTCSYYRIQCSTSPWFLELASHLGVSFHQVLGDIWMGTVNVLSYWQPQVQFITRKLFEKETTSTRDLQENQSERALVLSIF